jgi:hypothetical protein
MNIHHFLATLEKELKTTDSVDEVSSSGAIQARRDERCCTTVMLVQSVRSCGLRVIEKTDEEQEHRQSLHLWWWGMDTPLKWVRFVTASWRVLRSHHGTQST